MNILFVVPYVPSLVRVRPWNLIRYLSMRGHRVVVATLWSNEQERQEIEALRDVCEGVHAVRLPVWRSLVNCAKALPGAEPLQSVYSWSPDLYDQIRDLESWADVVHVEHLRGARYGLRDEANRAASAVPIVWDAVDCISYLFDQAARHRVDRIGQLINRLEVGRTRRQERDLVPRFDRVLVTSEVDRDALTALAPSSGEGQVVVLPNGVDTEYFSPDETPRHPKTLVFSGKMSYHANVSAVTDLVTRIMPQVWATEPDTELVIVGKSPPAEVRALGERHAPRVTVTGTVPDIRPFLRQATVAVVPLVYGAGIQNKVLEAMACATPVVARPRAVSALAARPGRDVLVAEETDAFARTVVDLLGSPSWQRRIGEAGRAFVEARHRWAEVAARLEGLYAEAITDRSRSLGATRTSLISA